MNDNRYQPQGSSANRAHSRTGGATPRPAENRFRADGAASRSTGAASRSTGAASRSTGAASRSTGVYSRSTGAYSRSTGAYSRSTGAASRSTGRPSSSPRRKRGGRPNPVLAVLSSILRCVRQGLSAVNHRLDFLRKGEAQSVVVNCALGGIAVFAVLCVLMACRPAINSARASSSARSGDVETALRIVSSMNGSGCSDQRMEDTRTAVAEGFIHAGEYDAALSVISELPPGDAAAALTQRANSAKAEALFEAGDYSTAAQLFYTLSEDAGAASRYADCRCALAIQAYQRGEESSARSLLLDVPDVAQRVSALAGEVAGSPEAAQAVLAAELFQADNLNRLEETMADLSSARSELPRGRIAAGKFHTVGVKSDGTVLATGDNRFHQCEVSSWTDIVAVAAAAYDTIGLRSDGTVVACGMHADKVSGWHGATLVAGGSYSLACLYDQGAMLCSHAAARMDMDVVLYDLSVCGPVSVGVLYDGTMVSTFDGAPDWTEMITVAATETGILGIDVTGAVRSFFYRPGDSVDLAVPGFAVGIASSGTHHVILTATGAVYAFGANDYGQCDVSGWSL